MSELAIRGGNPVRSEPYPSWPEVDRPGRRRGRRGRAERADRRLAGARPAQRRQFAERFAEYQGAGHGIVMVNGTVTMEVALKALGIGWGDEVIVPALTFAATAYAAIAAGALPVVVDVEPATPGRSTPTPSRRRSPRGRGDHAGAPGPADGRHGPAGGDRRAPRAGARGGLRPRARPAVGRPGAGCIGEFGSFSHQSSKILTVRRGRHAADRATRRWPGGRTRSSTAAGPRTRPARSTRSAPTTGWASCSARCS